jgi:hypothetical protein
MTDTVATSAAAPVVREFREILLWPLQLEPLHDGRQIQKQWEVLKSLPGGSVWSEVQDEFGDPKQFQERHYHEFVTFLPAVQRFLYGEGPHKAAHTKPVTSSLKVFRRRDIAAVRIVPNAGDEPVVLEIAHVDLYFFYDLDVVILSVEVFGNDLSLDTAQDLLFRFGRAYPPYWESGVRGATCAARTEFLDASGNVIATSDFGDRAKYLEFVCEHRAPLISSHWDFVMRPLVLHTSDEPGPLRYRQLEYYRMPVMAFLALDNPERLTRGDYVRFGLQSGPGSADEVPFSEEYLRGFEHRYCYDRHFGIKGAAAVNATRMLSGGHNLISVGAEASAFYTDSETGFLSQFRHQYFLLFLIAHLHKAALLMLSNRLAEAIQDLDIYDVESVKRFKRTIRQSHETFLRFTHRYWFHEVSIQVQAREVFAMITRHLESDELYGEVRDEMLDMESYLDSDNVRRQANVVVRLTVITTVGLIGTTATGFLGMNLIAEADSALPLKLVYFAVVFIPVVSLLLYTIVKSKRLSDFFEALSDERVGSRDKLRSLLGVWGRPKRRRAEAPGLTGR